MRVISCADLEQLTREARSTPRQRKNLNVHPSLSDPIQRLYNAMEPGTYVRPHRHPEPGKWEFFMAPRGALAALVFSAEGIVSHRLEIGNRCEFACVEVPADTWHTIVALEPGSVMFEVKPGPYSALGDKDFAAWAPPEGSPAAAAFEAWCRDAQPGDKAP